VLSDEQIERYSRQIILPQIGGKGQEKLLRARVLVHTQGLLSTAALHYLAAAGIGKIGVFAEAQEGLLAALASHQERDPVSVLTCLNPDCVLITHTVEEARTPCLLVQEYDLVIADSDLLHDACCETQRPFLYASLSHQEGRLIVCRGYEAASPCLRCASIFCAPGSPSSPLAKLGALFMGAHLVTEAIKQLLDLPCSPGTTLLRFDFLTFTCTEEPVQKSAVCPIGHPWLP
jgi:adenylyltransferase/sulfurtransferase